MTLFLLAACTSSDYPGWRNSLDDIEATLLEDGTCPDAPPVQAAMTDGTRYEPEWRVRSEEDSWVSGIHSYNETEADGSYTIVALSASDGGTLFECPWAGGSGGEGGPSGDGDPDDPNGVVTVDLDIHLAGAPAAPLFSAAPPIPGSSTLSIDGEEASWNTRDGTSYAWFCLEHAEDTSEGPDWSGAMALHLDDDGGRTPLDAFWAFDSVDCAYVEDAADSVDTNGWTTPADCDGLDNDFDGVVDEGASDWDEDGVPDCQQDP
jgi:hypothetical protein